MTSLPLRDVFAEYPVTSTEVKHEGLVWDVVRDTVDLGEGGRVRREYLRHPGAVGILALDERDRALLILQYRHPVRMRLWELPAGLLDDPSESPLQTARRELAEEVDLTAAEWHVLLDWFNSPGGMDEAIRVYLARGLTPVPDGERHIRQAEELDLQTRWVPLDEAREAVLAGGMHNPTAVVGILAACAARDRGWTMLRPADAPWPEHPSARPVTR
jgi:8-oxo-dGDP phosphatase